MKEENKINSEKLTMQLRSSIYSEFVSKTSKRSEINDIFNKIQEVFTNSFMSDYFDCEEDINFFKEHKNLLEFTYVYITPEVLDIEITEERHKNTDFKLSFSIPDLLENQPGSHKINSEDNKKTIQSFLKKHKIFNAFKRMYQEYINLTIQDEISCDKYLSTFPPRSWRRCEDFCSDCTTTLQLKNKYPEIYQIYLEISKRSSKDTLIDDLRRKLGFI